MVRHIVWWTLKPEAEGRTAAENAKLIKQRLEALIKTSTWTSYECNSIALQ